MTSSVARPLWTPDVSVQTRSRRFREKINHRYGLNLATYQDFWKWSVDNGPLFWSELWYEVGIVSSKLPDSFNSYNSAINMDELPTFFQGALFNYAENTFEGREASKLACVALREGSKEVQKWTWGALEERVRAMRSALMRAGIVKGDRVAALTSNTIVPIIIMLATASLGAVFTSTSPDMGAPGILDRLLQINPKIVFVDSNIVYKGKQMDILDKIDKIHSGLSRAQITPIFVINTFGASDYKSPYPTIENFVQRYSQKGDALVYEQVEFSYPLYILYSSGTSGPPKCIVHSHGGALMQLRKEAYLQNDLNEEDVLFQYSTTSWVMWNSMVGGLSSGMQIIVYDGSPFYPDKSVLLRVIKEYNVTCFGTSPRYLTELETNGIVANDILTGSKLRLVTSTGAVLFEAQYNWFYATWPSHIRVASMSGGTDLMACFVHGCPDIPVYAGEIQCFALGMATDVADVYTGESIVHTGQPGELVCRKPFPSMPIRFWGDKGGKKYHAAYYDRFPHVWVHGDFIMVNPKTGGTIMLGRSDGVLNPSGVRFGSAEIYTVVSQFPQVADSLCVGQRRRQDNDERVLLFLKMKDDAKFTQALAEQIKRAIKEALSSRHVPRAVFPVHDIPYTVNGKKVEIAVKQIISGLDVKVSATVSNPDSLQEYKRYVTLGNDSHRL